MNFVIWNIYFLFMYVINWWTWKRSLTVELHLPGKRVHGIPYFLVPRHPFGVHYASLSLSIMFILLMEERSLDLFFSVLSHLPGLLPQTNSKKYNNNNEKNYLDSHYWRDDDLERKMFNRETTKFWEFIKVKTIVFIRRFPFFQIYLYIF